jgi:fermentation-respiration switch protein FrsA (DUF1100 family)
MEMEYAANVGAIACGLLALVVFLPYLLVSGQETLLASYYAAGPVGATAVGFLALLNLVVFLSGSRGSADPDLTAGIALVLAVVGVALALLWTVSVDATLLFSFPSEYAWIEYHRWIVVVASLAVAADAVVYARAFV